MLKIETTRQFEKDLKLAKRRRKDLLKLKKVLSFLVEKRDLPVKYKNHKLSGVYKPCCDLHIEPDWLLLYRVNGDVVTLIRTGTHSDLFK